MRKQQTASDRDGMTFLVSNVHKGEQQITEHMRMSCMEAAVHTTIISMTQIPIERGNALDYGQLPMRKPASLFLAGRSSHARPYSEFGRGIDTSSSVEASQNGLAMPGHVHEMFVISDALWYVYNFSL